MPSYRSGKFSKSPQGTQLECGRIRIWTQRERDITDLSVLFLPCLLSLNDSVYRNEHELYRRLQDQKWNLFSLPTYRDPMHPWDTKATGDFGLPRDTGWPSSLVGGREGGIQIACQVGCGSCQASGPPGCDLIGSEISVKAEYMCRFGVSLQWAREIDGNWLLSRKLKHHLGRQQKSTRLKEKRETLSYTKDTEKSISKTETRPQYKDKAMGRAQPKRHFLKHSGGSYK